MKQAKHLERGGHLFTIAPDANFLDSVSKAVLDGRLPYDGHPVPDVLALSDYTILLPTRRAVRAMQAAFLRVVGENRALLLPRLRPVAEGEEEATLISAIAGPADSFNDFEISPAIGQLERRLVLMQLVQRWTDVMPEVSGHETAGMRSITPAQAARLAGELARFMDLVETENVDLDRLAGLVPDGYAAHWQKTLDFLQIVTAWWPQYLNASGHLSPADRRNRVILAEAERLRRQPPRGPVIVAGVTGSVPATTELIKAVHELPNGAVVMPGLDCSLSQEDVEAIIAGHPEHPQRGMLRVLDRLGMKIEQIRALSGERYGTHSEARNALIQEALRPAPSTNRWHVLPERIARKDARAALEGVTYLAAPTAQDEAEAVALILREAAERPGCTAALVTPDRMLARRVAVRLEAWDIDIDDSAGRPFPKTVPGVFFDLAINAVATDFEPCAVMALLKHPLLRLGRSALDVRRSVRVLEIAAFRTSYIGHGLDGLESALEKASQDVLDGRRRERALVRLSHNDWDGARALVHDLRNAYRPLTELFCKSEAMSLRAFVTAHVQTAEYLAALPDEAEEEGKAQARELWRGAAGEAAARLFASFLDPCLPELDISAADYPDFYRTLVADEAVRSQVPRHPRIFIWGPFEARLQRPDVIILGSLNEGTWPQAADTGPWLNRPMLLDMGLPAPEEKTGFAAHDFTQFLGCEQVYLTRAEMVDGNPTVLSRWILRLQAVLSSLDLNDVLESRQPLLEWARLRDAAPFHPPAERPTPKPPVALRPRSLSVSSIETWIANPYAIFARHILKLDALPPLGADPDASLKGSVVHDILGRYLKKFPKEVPADPALELLAISEQLFGELRSHPRIAAFWVERFRRFAAWFASVEPSLRETADHSLAETGGAFVFDAAAGPFTLTARADRIDMRAAGLAITDYKTAAHMQDLVARAKSGRAPQLLLEALIAERSGFAGVPACQVSQLRYVSVSGGDPPGTIAEVKFEDLGAAICGMERELGALIARFDEPDTPYAATRRAHFRYDFDDYAHLARVAEWSGEGMKEGGAE